MENSEALSKIENEIKQLSQRINDLKNSENAVSESGLELISAQLKLADQTLEVLQQLSKKDETRAVAEETIPVNIEQVVGMSLENNAVTPVEEKKEEPTPVAKKIPLTAKEEKADNSLAGKMKNKPIADLKSAIGINEKFAFIKLFGGDSTAWTNALQKLNSFSAYWEAEAILSEYQQKYNWKEDDEALQSLTLLVQRRYL